MFFAFERLLQIGEDGHLVQQLPDERLKRCRRGHFGRRPSKSILGQTLRWLARRARQLRNEQRSLPELLFSESLHDFGDDLDIF